MTGVIEIPLLDFAGYHEKVAREHHLRRVACLGLKTTICGIEVKPLCAQHISLLMFLQSPFLCGVTIPELVGTKEKNFDDGRPALDNDIMLFLWIVSPHYVEGFLTCRGIWRVETSCDKFNTAWASIQSFSAAMAVREILQYVDDAFNATGLTKPSERLRQQNKLN